MSSSNGAYGEVMMMIEEVVVDVGPSGKLKNDSILTSSHFEYFWRALCFGAHGHKRD